MLVLDKDGDGPDELIHTSHPQAGVRVGARCQRSTNPEMKPHYMLQHPSTPYSFPQVVVHVTLLDSDVVLIVRMDVCIMFVRGGYVCREGYENNGILTSLVTQP